MRAIGAGFAVLVFLLVGCSADRRGHSAAARSRATAPRGQIARANVGQTQSIVVDPANSRVVFAVTAIVASGLTSTDGGAHWHDFSPMGASVLSVAFDPQHPRTVYVGGDDGCGVLRSTNGGKSWQKAGLNGCTIYKNGYVKKHATGQPVSALAIAPGGRVLYAGTSLNVGDETNSNAVFRSVDGGRSWRWISNSPGGDIPLLVLDPKNPRILYTWTQGVFKSTDGGAIWHPLNVPGAVDTLAIDPHNPQNVYAGAGFSGGVLKSANGGSSWRIAGLDGDDVEALAIDPQNSQTIYAGTLGGIFESSDGGRTWRLFGLSGQNVWTLAIASNGRLLDAGTDDAVVALRVSQ